MRNSRYFGTCVCMGLPGYVRVRGRQEEEEEKKNKAYRQWSAHEGEEKEKKTFIRMLYHAK